MASATLSYHNNVVAAPDIKGEECGMDNSLPSSTGSVSTNATNATVELEKRFQQALTLKDDTQHQIMDDAEVNQVTQEELDSLYAKDMFELTGQEREEALQDIHGVSDTIEETPEFVQEHRQHLQQELLLLVSRPRHKTFAYQQAMKQDTSYVCSREFQVLFLRADRWRARDAAARLIAFLETKLELFGSQLLTKRITISHLSKDDRKSLESGFFQLLSVRDAGGRALIAGMPMLRQYKHLDNLKRTFFYIIMAALEDDATQKAGIVMVGYNMGPRRVMDRKAAFAIQSMRRHLPYHMASIHFCYDDFRIRPMMTVAMLVMGSTTRVRFRAHYGHYKDVLSRLSTFGIPCVALPVDNNGEPKIKAHRNWLRQRNSQEEAEAARTFPSAIVVIPNRVDILLGRGKPIQGHFGNMRYQSVLDYYQDAYERAIKFQKRNISQRILEMVAEYGGRFLRQEGAGWIQVDESVARDKVAHAFRTRRVASGGVAPVVTPVPSSNDDTLISIGALSSGTKRNKSAMMDSTALARCDEDYTALDIDPANTVSSDEFFLSEDEHAQPDKRLCV